MTCEGNIIHTSALRVAVIGLGAVGQAVAEAVCSNPEMILVGLADNDPAWAGRSFLSLPVTDELDQLPQTDAAIVTTGSRFDRIAPTLRQLLARRTHVVSRCQEMIWPWLRHPHLADAIANEARKAGVAVLGLGTEPRTLESLLPALRRFEHPTRVRLRRQSPLLPNDATRHRQIGIGRTAEQFRKLAIERLVGLPGLGETAVLIAQSLGQHPMRADVRTTLKPTLGEDGRVKGLRQLTGWIGDELDIEIEYVIEADVPADGDVEIAGAQTVRLPMATDSGLVESLIEASAKLPKLSAGLLTPLDRFLAPAP